jgi:hypothetical protein
MRLEADCVRLADVYARKLDVLNRGFGGYNTEM